MRRLEPLEGLGRGGHLEAQRGHEDEVGVGAEGEQPVAIECAEGGDTLGIETGLAQCGLGVLQVSEEDMGAADEDLAVAIVRTQNPAGRECSIDADSIAWPSEDCRAPFPLITDWLSKSRSP